ncbi:MAG: OmpA family protein [Myxococcota bacterium]
MRPLSLALLLLAGCAADTLRLRHVVLYQNGVGYFEREGVAEADRLRIPLRRHEVDDVMKTLTVIGADGNAALSAVVPEIEAPPAAEEGAPAEATGTTSLDVTLRDAGGPVTVAYAVPTPTWRAVYRLVLSETGDEALLQAWAVVHNQSNEDWQDVQLTLATGAPFTYAMDLRTPEFVARPDLTGSMVGPATNAPVRATRARDDGDGVGSGDRCPTQPEDRDGFEDEDGCPDPDNDEDRIPDVEDNCPNDPETYNGYSDEDGCPDSGLVLLTEDQSLTVLERVYFTANSSRIQPRSRRILDAVAATLQGNPQVTRVSVVGHAAQNERRAVPLSASRAAEVRRALIARGVAGDRLQLVARGNERPIDPRRNRRAYDRNRRVDFTIEESDPSAPPARRSPPRRPRPRRRPQPRAITPEVAAVPPQALAFQGTGAGDTRYLMPGTVDIPRGSASMVAIVNLEVPGSEVLLFRPDPATGESDRHPFRAARLVNEASVDLIEGPVALFARGTYVGEGVLDGLMEGEATFLPFALDATTEVSSDATSEVRPHRLVRVQQDRMLVENRRVRRTTYTVRGGPRAVARLWIRHVPDRGFTPIDLPADTELDGTGVLVPVDVTPGDTTMVRIVEERIEPVSRWLRDSREVLTRYVQGDLAIPLPIRRSLDAAFAIRARIRELLTTRDGVRTELDVQSRRLDELQASLVAVGRSRGGAALRRQVRERLGATEAETERLSRREAEIAAELTRLRVELDDAVDDLRYDRNDPPRSPASDAAAAASGEGDDAATESGSPGEDGTGDGTEGAP